MEPELLRYLKLLIKMVIAVLLLLAVYLLFTFVFPIMGGVLKAIPAYIMPFVLALLLAILIEPAINFCQRRLHISRGPATVLSIFVVLGTLGAVIAALISRLLVELVDLYRTLSQSSSQISLEILDVLQKAQIFYVKLNLPRNVEESLQSNLNNLMTVVQEIIKSSVNVLINIVAGLPGFFILLLIAVVATYFIAKERPLLRQWISQFLPNSWWNKTRDVYGSLARAFVGFMKAEFILVSMTMLQLIIGFKILGVQYALTLGMVAGLLDIMPVLGPGTIIVPWVVISFIQGRTGFAIGLLALYGLTTMVRYLVEPKIIGQNVGLHPLATLISLYIGLKAAGVIGMILGPIIVIFYLACRRAGVFDQLPWKRTE